MRTKIQTYYELEKEIANEFPKLSAFEKLSIAVQIQRNQILENGLVVSNDDRNPSGIEAVGIALGFSGRGSETISETLKDLNSILDK